MKRLAMFAAFVLSLPLSAQQRQTENTFRLAEGEASPEATIEVMSWFAGHWKGSGLGGECEEMWTAPVDGSMIGSFRFVLEGKPVFYELQAISEHEGSLVFRVKHFNPDMKGWEEKDDRVEFPLVAVEDGAVHFEGLSFHPDGDDLTIYLAIGTKDGVKEETFRYSRTGS